MTKIYKSSKGKLIVYLPQDVVNALKLKENEEIDFFKMNDSSYLLAKKSDVTNMILGKQQPQQSEEPRQKLQQSQKHQQGTIPDEYIAVLKKIDTVRYNERTPENVARILNEQEKRVLQRMIAEQLVNQFKKNSKELYSITKSVYDQFLMRKKPQQQQQSSPVAQQFKKQILQSKAPPLTQGATQLDEDAIKSLEANGFVVLQTEAEASRVSLTLEQSIRHGQVLGTRAFNKKFYIVLRSYFDSHGGNILKKLRERSYRVSDIAKELSINEDGARSILYLLSENGDVSEKKRDTFTIA
ncbi:MAG: hypothetical protein KGH64_02545 [Candidatus Micrarchaeota archaeon]|nr:hypothetical protein [Candidatus Micrarchaeota archaeon]MDE1859410.1 hypothetical protein [Candidatus Micrarchaeota archaeon]